MLQVETRIVTLGRRTSRKHAAAEDLFSAYVDRIRHHCRCQHENFSSEAKFLAAQRQRAVSRAQPLLVLLDSRGRALSTDAFAARIGTERDQGTRQMVFAVGPADGWSDAAREHANLLLSLGPMTLPHELAAVVLAEQIYRSFTILDGLPYHLGHSSE